MQIDEKERETADQNTRGAEVVASFTTATHIYVSYKIRMSYSRMLIQYVEQK